jgi:hypothetical protein
MTDAGYVAIGYLIAIATWALLIWWSGRRAGQS